MGQAPNIPQEPTPQAAVAMEFDFRNVYGTILEQWLGCEQDRIGRLLHSAYKPIPFIKN
jgi:hypothetical protein